MMNKEINLHKHSIIFTSTYLWDKDLTDRDIYMKSVNMLSNGDIKFMVLISAYTRFGIGCTKSTEISSEWLSKAYDSNDADTLALLGDGYHKGWIGEKNDDKARLCFDKLENICNYKKLYMYGYYFLDLYQQTGERYNLKHARENFKKAANIGHMCSLLMYCSISYNNLILQKLCVLFKYILNYKTFSKISESRKWWCYRDFINTWPSIVKIIDDKLLKNNKSRKEYTNAIDH